MQPADVQGNLEVRRQRSGPVDLRPAQGHYVARRSLGMNALVNAGQTQQ